MDRLLKSFQRLKTINTDSLFLFIFKQNEVQEKVFDLIREQLGRGEKGDGSEIGTYSNRSQTVFDKPTLENPFLEGGGDAIRLYDTGDYYDSFTPAAINAQFFSWRSDTLKDGDNGEVTNLNEVYGSSIDELQPESIVKLSEFLKPKAKQYIDEFIKKSFKV